MRRVSSEIESRIIEMWFEGFNRDEISKKLNISGSTVSAVKDSLPPCLTPLRDVAFAIKKANATVPESLQGAIFLRQLAELGIKTDQIPSVIQAHQKMSKEYGYEPDKLTQVALKVAVLENWIGKPYPEAIKELEKTAKSNAEAEEQHNKLIEQNRKVKHEIKENERRRNKAFKEANVTPKEIEEYKNSKKALLKENINLSDIEGIKSMVSNMKETNRDPEQLIFLAKKHSSLQEAVSNMEQQKTRKETEMHQLQTESQQSQAVKESLGNEIQWKTAVLNDLNTKIVNLTGHYSYLQREANELWHQINALNAYIAMTRNFTEDQKQTLNTLTNMTVYEETAKSKLKEIMAKNQLMYESALLNMRKSLAETISTNNQDQ